MVYIIFFTNYLHGCYMLTCNLVCMVRTICSDKSMIVDLANLQANTARKVASKQMSSPIHARTNKC